MYLRFQNSVWAQQNSKKVTAFAIWLSGIGIAVLIPHLALAQSSPEAMKCLEGFLKTFDKIQSYRVEVLKHESVDPKNPLDDHVEITQDRTGATRISYLNKNSTGIKANGMEIDYDGRSDKMKVTFGQSYGFGSIVNGLAGIIVGKQIALNSKDALDKEIFTINRAGFLFLYETMKKNLEQIRKAEHGGVKLEKENTCDLAYEPHVSGFLEEVIAPTLPVSQIENKYGVVAFMIQRANQSEFSDLYHFYNRSKSFKIKIPGSFYPFQFRLNTKTHLPEMLSLKENGRTIAKYEFLKVDILATDDDGKPAH